MQKVINLLNENGIDSKDIAIREGVTYTWYKIGTEVLFSTHKNMSIEDLEFKDINPAGSDDVKFQEAHLKDLIETIKGELCN